MVYVIPICHTFTLISKLGSLRVPLTDFNHTQWYLLHLWHMIIHSILLANDNLIYILPKLIYTPLCKFAIISIKYNCFQLLINWLSTHDIILSFCVNRSNYFSIVFGKLLVIWNLYKSTFFLIHSDSKFPKSLFTCYVIKLLESKTSFFFDCFIVIYFY